MIGMSWRKPFLCVLFSLLVGGLVCLWASWPAAQEPDSWPPKAWEKVAPHLKQLDEKAEKARKRRLAEVETFFTQRAVGSKRFAEDALSWGGRWALVKDKVGFSDEAHARFLEEAFARDVFRADELQAVLERAIRGYISDLEGMENEMLVELRADLADGELGRGAKPGALQSNEAFLQEYRRLTAEMTPMLSRELGIKVGREAGSFIAMDIGTQIVIRVSAAVAAELGISAGVLSSGVASGIVTLGVGIVVAFIVDALIDRLMRAWGYDPEAEVGADVNRAVTGTKSLLIEGDKNAWQMRDSLRLKASSDWFPSVRAACTDAADGIERGGHMGLGWEMTRLERLRAGLRKEALRKMVSEGGMP